jgi:glycosyltransferase involved in cell wall biosynthesis
MKPDVSVVIPTYNRRQYLEHSIDSCYVGNEDIEVEVVVVDDGSTDDTRSFLNTLEDGRVRPVFQKNQGASAARNRGMEEATGEYIKFLDDDDYLLPGALACQYEVLHAADAEVCYGDYRIQPEDGKNSHIHSNQEYSSLFVGLASGNVNRFPFSFLFDRAALGQIRWDETLGYLEDVEFMIRASSQRRLRSVKVKEPVAVHRIHEGERLSDDMKEDPTGPQLRLKCEIYWEAYQRFAEEEPVEDRVRLAAAMGLWREAHKLAPYDWQKAVHWLRRVREIEPHFRPERDHAVLSVLDSLFPPLVTERLANPLRRYRLRA